MSKAAGIAACVLEDDGSLELSGMDYEIGAEEWFANLIEEALATTNGEPDSIQEALRGTEKQEWKDAVEKELSQVEGLRMYDIIPTPPGVNIAKNRYTFCLKKDDQGRIIRYKAWLVLKGFSQIYGIDFHETFAPTVRLTTLRALLSVATQKDAEIHQADIKMPTSKLTSTKPCIWSCH